MATLSRLTFPEPQDLRPRFALGRCSRSEIVHGCRGLQSGAKGEKWQVMRDGESATFSQKAAYEVAVEVAVAQAAGNLRTGHEIGIEVLGSTYDRAGDGSRRAVVEDPRSRLSRRGGIPLTLTWPDAGLRNVEPY